MSFTYATLKTAIQDYTQNTETTFVSHLDDFIKNAEDNATGMSLKVGPVRRVWPNLFLTTLLHKNTFGVG